MFDYINANKEKYIRLLSEHLNLTIIALMISIAIGLSISFIIYKNRKLSNFITQLTSSVRVVPSIVLMLIFMPTLGTGRLPALLALVIIGLPFIFANTINGLINVDEEVIEAAYSTGMNEKELFYKIRLPLSLPSIITGMRMASLSIAAGAPIAAYIGAGGLGEFILSGISQMRTDIIMTGSITIMLICLALELFFQLIYMRVTRYR